MIEWLKRHEIYGILMACSGVFLTSVAYLIRLYWRWKNGSRRDGEQWHKDEKGIGPKDLIVIGAKRSVPETVSREGFKSVLYYIKYTRFVYCVVGGKRRQYKLYGVIPVVGYFTWKSSDNTHGADLVSVSQGERIENAWAREVSVPGGKPYWEQYPRAQVLVPSKRRKRKLSGQDE